MNTKISVGFTLIELVVTLAVVAILTTVGLPALGDYLRNSRLTTQTNDLVAAFNFARGEAITRNQNVYITMLNISANTANEWGPGWEIWIDGRRDGDCAATSIPDNARQDCEVLRVFDYRDRYSDSAMTRGFPTINQGENNLISLSLAPLASPLKEATLMYSGSDGSLALTSAALNFFVCDDRAKTTGRHLIIRRTGRIILQDDRYRACS
jgi:prepilin-type N-terminal cleavage/methylation domain-containing protein